MHKMHESFTNILLNGVFLLKPIKEILTEDRQTLTLDVHFLPHRYITNIFKRKFKYVDKLILLKLKFYFSF